MFFPIKWVFNKNFQKGKYSTELLDSLLSNRRKKFDLLSLLFKTYNAKIILRMYLDQDIRHQILIITSC